MKIELTDEEVTTMMVALDNYREIAEREFHHSGEEEDREQAGSAEWCWQKLFHAQQVQINNQTNASVDPFSLPSEEK